MAWINSSIPKLQRLHRWSLGLNKKFYPSLYEGCNIMRGLKWIHFSKSHALCTKSANAESLVNTITLTHWGRVMHICLGKITIIASDYGFLPGRRQTIIWTKAGILLIGPLGTKFDEILIEIHTFSFKKMHLKMSSVKWRPFCLGPNVLKWHLLQGVNFTTFAVQDLGVCKLV